MAGPSSTGNYAASAIAAARDNERILQGTLQNSPDYSKIVQEAAIRRSKENIAALRAETKVQMAGVQQFGATAEKKALIDAKEDLRSAKRKAGVLASAGSLLGTGLAGLAPSDRKKREIGEESDFFQTQIDKKKAEADELRARAEGLTTEPSFTPDSAGSTPETSNAGSTPETSKDTGSSGVTDDGRSKLASASISDDLLNLSDKDKKDIAYIVSGEAARGTDDIYGVAGVVLNRMKSNKYPSSAFDVGHQKGQFEAVEIGTARHEPELVNKLFSEEGLKKLQGALTTLDGRDSFKGQALLKNRVKDEDPMFHSRGNFYHHSWQN